MRKPRILVPNARYHVTARANHQEMRLDPKGAKTLFLEVVACAKKRFEFRLDNFVLMGNHFHFLIQPLNDSNLSRIMKWILQTFAIRYNKLNNLWGHFWGDRFFSWVIPNYREFLRVFDYLDQNPANAGLVSHPRDWEWGALWFRRTGVLRWLDPLPEWLGREFPDHRRVAIAETTR